jgi:lipopolysaccharide transport system ATP-binding protein
MANTPVAVVENVGKCYHVYDKNIDRLKQAFVFGKRKLYREFWALRHVSFDVEKGETLGIVGANGSGKSTLLQLMFGVLRPTEGKLFVQGRVGGLLELGAGFNPEETGRSNVLINAAILGIKPEAMPALFDRVAAFADIGDFLDQPIKVYSSGMAVRLGFALQISVPADVLIIDEALAVGDELFQRKCYAALENFRDNGGTVIFVSHSAAAVKQMCRRAVFLDHGRLIQRGRCKTVVDNYQKFLYMREPEKGQFRADLMASEPVPLEAGALVDPMASLNIHSVKTETLRHDATYVQGVDRDPAPADYEPGLATQSATYYQPLGAVISEPRVETLDGRKVNLLNPHERYVYRYRVQFRNYAREIVFGWLVKSTSGVELGGGAHDSSDGYIAAVSPGDVYLVSFEFTASLYPGVYYLNCGVSGRTDDYDGFLHRVLDAVAFRVRNVYSKLVTGFADFDFRSSFQIESGENHSGHAAAFGASNDAGASASASATVDPEPLAAAAQ